MRDMTLVTCPQCARHIRATDAHCPFCNDSRPAVGPNGLVAAALVGASLTLVGCSPRPQGTLYGSPPEPIPSETSAPTPTTPGDKQKDGAKDGQGGGAQSNKDGDKEQDAGVADVPTPSPPMKTLYGAPPLPDKDSPRQ